MSQLKLIVMTVCFGLVMVATASADPWGRYPRGYYRPYGPPIYAYPPVVVPPPPVVVGPPVYSYPAPVYAAPPAPIYGPPVVGYGVIGPRGRLRLGYATPGFGVMIRP